MTDKPESAADPRPDGEPYYIDTECPNCGTALMLEAELTDEQRRQSDAFSDPEYVDDDAPVWHDSWVCPTCLNGVHLDWPEGEWARFIESIRGFRDG